MGRSGAPAGRILWAEAGSFRDQDDPTCNLLSRTARKIGGNRAERLTKEPLRIVGGHVAVPDRPGLGIDIDMDRVRVANELYNKIGTSARDDAMAMQYLVPGWTYDAKRPSLGRVAP